MKTLTMKKVKSMIEDEVGMKLDFRTHVFVDNEYGSIPCVDYDTMKEIVVSLFTVLNLDIMCHNSGMMLNELKSETLKNMIERLIEDYNNRIDVLTTIEEVEIFDNGVEDENGLTNILEISVGITLQNYMFIDFQTSMLAYNRFSTNLEEYLEGSFSLDDLHCNEEIANEILEYIKEKAQVQKVYDDYVKENYELIDPPYSWDTEREENFLARRKL